MHVFTVLSPFCHCWPEFLSFFLGCCFEVLDAGMALGGDMVLSASVSCHHILQGHPSPKKQQRSLGLRSDWWHLFTGSLPCLPLATFARALIVPFISWPSLRSIHGRESFPCSSALCYPLVVSLQSSHRPWVIEWDALPSRIGTCWMCRITWG